MQRPAGAAIPQAQVPQRSFGASATVAQRPDGSVPVQTTAGSAPAARPQGPNGATQRPAAAAQPEVRLVNRALPPEPPVPHPPEPGVTLFAPEGSAEGCASGECLPSEPAILQRPGLSPPPPAPGDFELEEEAPAPVAQVETEHDRWEKAVDAVRQASPRHGKSLSFARFLGFTPEGVRVAFAPDAAFHRAQVTGMSRAIVETELARALGKPTKLIEDTNAAAFAGAKKSIAEVEAHDRASRERAIDSKIKDHPAIRSVLRHLGGSIEHVQYLEPVAAPKPALVPAEEAVPGEE